MRGRVLVLLVLMPMLHSQDLPREDEVVVLFATAGYRTPDGDAWLLPMHGWIHEPEEDSLWRGALLESLVRMLELDAAAAESAIFRERAAAFLVDNERGKELTVLVEEQGHLMPASEANGHFRGLVRLRREEDREVLAGDGVVPVQVQTREDDARRFAGVVTLVPPRGISVISDLDDTVKVSEVLDRRALIRNTFLRPFEPVPGMAELYRAWADQGIPVHYVSSSPWQLYVPLLAFLQGHGFPVASMHLKAFRVKDQSFLDLLADPELAKPRVIEPLLAAYPDRRFILVGDSGEKDPEVYGELARCHPGQIERIFIRNVTGEERGAERWQEAFRDLDPALWQLFEKPSEVTHHR